MKKYCIRDLLIFLIISLIFVLLCIKVDSISDDAFISFRYAKNLISGNGLVFNPGERVEGYTNFLLVLIEGLLLKAGIDPLLGVRIISLLSGIVIFFLLLQISVKHLTVKRYYYFLSLFLLSTNVGFVCWAYSGMESVIFTMFIVLEIYFFIEFLMLECNKYIFLSSFFGVMASLVRPDGVLFVLCSLIFLIFFYNKHTKLNKAAVKVAFLLLPFFIIYLPYFIWRYNYYGYLFPNTFYVKSGGIFFTQIRGLYYLMKFIKEGLAVGLLLIPVFYVIFKFAKNNIYKYIFLNIGVYLVFVIAVGGDGIGIQRFIIPVMPMIFILVQNGIIEIFDEFNIPKKLKIFIISIIIISSFSIILDNKHPMSAINMDRVYFKNCIQIGKWLKENSSENESIALNISGIIPYYSELYTIDRLGLSNIKIAHKYVESMGKGTAGHEKKDDDYVFSLKPTYFIEHWPSSERLCKEDIVTKEFLVYKFHSENIGTGLQIVDQTHYTSGDVYFNYYKLDTNIKGK